MIYSSTFRSDTRGVRVVTNVERNAVDVEVPSDVRRWRGRRSRVVLARPCSAKSSQAEKLRGGRRWQTLVHRGDHV